MPKVNNVHYLCTLDLKLDDYEVLVAYNAGRFVLGLQPPNNWRAHDVISMVLRSSNSEATQALNRIMKEVIDGKHRP